MGTYIIKSESMQVPGYRSLITHTHSHRQTDKTTCTHTISLRYMMCVGRDQSERTKYSLSFKPDHLQVNDSWFANQPFDGNARCQTNANISGRPGDLVQPGCMEVQKVHCTKSPVLPRECETYTTTIFLWDPDQESNPGRAAGASMIYNQTKATLH